MAVLHVDVCDGFGYTEYFDESAVCNISMIGNVIEIVGNKDYLILLARQMIYFASNDFCLPYGSHIHYDTFRHSDYRGLELILEVMRAPKQSIILDVNETIQVEIDIPEHAEDLYKCWTDSCKVFVKCGEGSVHLLGNANGLRFISAVLLFLVTKGENGTSFTCANQLLKGWDGISIKFVHT